MVEGTGIAPDPAPSARRGTIRLPGDRSAGVAHRPIGLARMANDLGVAGWTIEGDHLQTIRLGGDQQSPTLGVHRHA